MAENCLLEISCRFQPSISSKKLYKKIKASIKQVDDGAKIEIMLLGKPFLNKNRKDINRLKNIVTKQLGNTSLLLGKAWSEVALFDINKNSCFVLGPGEPSQAHYPNEFIEIDKFNKFCNVYSNILESF